MSFLETSDIEIGDLHELFANTFIGLAGVHAVAALIHHFVFKDGVLKSMSPH